MERDILTIEVTTEELTKGTKKQIKLDNGKKVNITIPKNANLNEIIVLSGLGKDGKDLEIKLKELVKEKSILEIGITEEELANGTSRKIKLDNGKKLHVNIPKGTKLEDTVLLDGLGESGKDLELTLVLDQSFKEQIQEELNKEVIPIEEPKQQVPPVNSNKVFYQEGIVNYNCIVFVSKSEITNGCYKKVKIPRYGKKIIPIYPGIEDKEIISVNVEGLLLYVLVILRDEPSFKVDLLNNSLNMSEVTISKKDLNNDSYKTTINYEKKFYNVNVPRFNSRKLLVYTDINNDSNTGIKVVAKNNDMRSKIRYLIDCIYALFGAWFILFYDFAYHFGQFVAIVLSYLLLTYIIDNKWD